MKLGIDISQIVYEGTGVARYVRRLVEALIATAPEHEYVLFGASLRARAKFREFFVRLQPQGKKLRLVSVPIPPTVLDWLWNKLHFVPVEWFTGPLDVFWSSDWTQPPLSHARGVTTIHDLSFWRYPESFAKKIITVQERRLRWAKKECRAFICDSQATKRDVGNFLGIPKEKLYVVYPGLT